MLTSVGHNPAAAVELSAEQREAIRRLLAFSKPVQTLGGYAGTGKTTVIKQLVRHLPNFAVCAYTGKAANVLRRKGVPASTIHSLVYKPVEYVKRDENNRPCGVETRWELKPPKELGYAGFIVDEASMVGDSLAAAIRSYGKPVIFVGDHGQLEPVGERGSLMVEPDITLEQIHRNAGEIAHFANFIRQGNDPTRWVRRPIPGKAAGIRFMNALDVANEARRAVGGLAWDQIICTFNELRVDINRIIRSSLDYPADEPVVGDRVMCLQNNRIYGVFNGQQGTIKALYSDERMGFEVDGREIVVPYRADAFNKVKRPESRGYPLRVPFDYAYCITCHKAQGDEWDNILVIDQRRGYAPWQYARWAYTAASRARRRLDWFATNLRRLGEE